MQDRELSGDAHCRSSSRAGTPVAAKSPSFLDKLQKDAQSREMDHTNTSPALFVVFTVTQVAVVLGVSFLIDGDTNITVSFAHMFSLAGVVAILSHFVGFLVSEAIGSCFMFDITGEVTFGGMILWIIANLEKPSLREMIVLGLAMVWCLRLGAFLFWRILVRGSDWRFDKLIKGHCYNMFAWVCQGSWIWLQGFCLWTLTSRKFLRVNPGSDELDWSLYVGVTVFSMGFACEVIADKQKTAWNAATKSGKQSSWIEVGLWRFSRHPNYFGEMLLWLGLAICCFGDLTTPGRVLALVSFVWSSFFLFFTSLMLLEKRLDGRFGGQPAYEDYKRRTSVLVLWPPTTL